MGSLTSRKEGIDGFLEQITTTPKPVKMNESAMQYAIYKHIGMKELFPNITIGCNEWDAVNISQAGYPTCYEIKISKSDFKVDMKKDRHLLLKNRQEQSPENKYIKLGILPKYVYYVIHGFTLKDEEIPDYAGLMIVSKYGIEIQKQAPVLWKVKIPEKQRNVMYRIMAKRYIYKSIDRCKDVFDNWKRSNPK